MASSAERDVGTQKALLGRVRQLEEALRTATDEWDAWMLSDDAGDFEAPTGDDWDLLKLAREVLAAE